MENMLSIAFVNKCATFCWNRKSGDNDNEPCSRNSTYYFIFN